MGVDEVLLCFRGDPNDNGIKKIGQKNKISDMIEK